MGAYAFCQKLQQATSERNRRLLRPVLLAMVGRGVIGLIWLRTGPRELRGRLVYLSGDRDRMWIPEDPPPDAWLMTPSKTYELVIEGCGGRSPDRALQRRLASMEGHEIIVRGRLGTRRTMMKGHPGAIFVREISLVPGTKTAASLPT